MPSILDPQLSVQTDHAAGTANVTVTCDLEFTDFEVNSMNIIGLHFTLECQLLSMEALAPVALLAFDPQQFPQVRDGASRYAHPIFQAIVPMNELHLYPFGKDSLLAELRLSNEDVGTLSAKRTPTVLVDLAAPSTR